MIRTESYKIRLDGVELIHTWSDLGMMIRQVETDTLYEDATDVPGLHSYVETDIPIEDEDIEDSEALRLITGVAE